jgi:hypothetical protein
METEYNNNADMLTYENNDKYDKLIYSEHTQRKQISEKQRKHLQRIRDLKRVKNLMRKISKQQEYKEYPQFNYLSSLFYPTVALMSLAGVAYGVGMITKKHTQHVHMLCTEDKETQYETYE